MHYPLLSDRYDHHSLRHHLNSFLLQNLIPLIPHRHFLQHIFLIHYFPNTANNLQGRLEPIYLVLIEVEPCILESIAKINGDERWVGDYSPWLKKLLNVLYGRCLSRGVHITCKQILFFVCQDFTLSYKKHVNICYHSLLRRSCPF